MKSNFPLILAWTWILVSAAVGEECGWREVERKLRINFNWHSHTLEVKTKGISIDDNENKQLEIMLDTEKRTREIVLKIWNFYLTESHNTGVVAETLNFDIVFPGANKYYIRCWTRNPPGELHWTFILKKKQRP